MARAKHLYEYVKKGTSDGFVEIELKGRPHKKNLIIMRKFTKDSDRSDFFINSTCHSC